MPPPKCNAISHLLSLLACLALIQSRSVLFSHNFTAIDLVIYVMASNGKLPLKQVFNSSENKISDKP